LDGLIRFDGSFLVGVEAKMHFSSRVKEQPCAAVYAYGAAGSARSIPGVQIFFGRSGTYLAIQKGEV
jgi:hypothetical protein